LVPTPLGLVTCMVTVSGSDSSSGALNVAGYTSGSVGVPGVMVPAVVVQTTAPWPPQVMTCTRVVSPGCVSISFGNTIVSQMGGPASKGASTGSGVIETNDAVTV